MKSKMLLIGVLCAAMFVPAVRAQTTLITASALAVAAQSLEGLPIGAAITINGQTFTVQTNASGAITGIVTSGAAGSAAVSTLTSPAQVAQAAAGYVAQNNTNDLGYYGTNDLCAKVSVNYCQNSGDTLADISVSKYGLLKSVPSLGLEGGVLQGNQGGVQSTAGGYGGIDYRKPIGSVAAHVGADVVWDNWSSQIGGAAHAGVELRQGPHLGEYAGVRYEFEATSSKPNLSGLQLEAGITYAF